MIITLTILFAITVIWNCYLVNENRELRRPTRVYMKDGKVFYIEVPTRIEHIHLPADDDDSLYLPANQVQSSSNINSTGEG